MKHHRWKRKHESIPVIVCRLIINWHPARASNNIASFWFCLGFFSLFNYSWSCCSGIHHFSMVSAVASIWQCVLYWWKCVPTRPASVHGTRGSAEPLAVIPVWCWKGTVPLPWQIALVFCYWSLHKIASNCPFCLPMVCDSCDFFGGVGGGSLLLCFCWLKWNSDYSCMQLWGRVSASPGHIHTWAVAAQNFHFSFLTLSQG